MPMNLRPERAGGEFFLRRGRLHGNDDIGLHLDEWAIDPIRNSRPPEPLRSRISSVCNNEARVFGQFSRPDLRGFVPDDHLNPAFLERSLGFPKPFQHKNVMPQISLGEMRRDPEECEKRFALLIRFLDGIFQRMVTLRPLGGLHPVEKICPVFDRLIVEELNPLFLDQIISAGIRPRPSRYS